MKEAGKRNDHFSLLVGGIDGGKPCLYHLNRIGIAATDDLDIPFESKWDVAVIGHHAKDVTKYLKKQYKDNNFEVSKMVSLLITMLWE